MIRFHYAYTGFSISQATKVKKWLEAVAQYEHKAIERLEYQFVSDDALLDINRQSLNHNYYTDIITFPYSTDPISGEIFISVDRVREHAIQYKVGPRHELLRVMVHGLLHLCGHLDTPGRHRKQMTIREDLYLSKAQPGLIDRLS